MNNILPTLRPRLWIKKICNRQINIHSFHRVNSDGIFDHPQAADFWQVTHLESFNQQQRCSNNKSAVQLLQEGCIVLVVQRSHPAGDGIGPGC